VRELDLESIINANDDAEKRKSLESELGSIRGELLSVSEQLEKTYDLIKVRSSQFVAGKIQELEEKQQELTKRYTTKEKEQQEFIARDSRFYSSREDIKELVKTLQMPASDEVYKIRAQIASRLKVLVGTLLVAPRGALPTMQRTIGQLKAISGTEADDVVAYMQQLAEHPEQSRRYFAVGFRDAAVRVVYPAYADPLRYEQQIVAGTSEFGDEDRT
jgi:hypothetical protein